MSFKITLHKKLSVVSDLIVEDLLFLDQLLDHLFSPAQLLLHHFLHMGALFLG